MLVRLGSVSVTPVAGSPKTVDVVAEGASRRVLLSPMADEGAPTSVGFSRLMRRFGSKGMPGHDGDSVPVVLFSRRNAETCREEAHTMRLLDGCHDPETGRLHLRMKAITSRKLTRDGEACDGWQQPRRLR
jgi:hypothetical protein